MCNIRLLTWYIRWKKDKKRKNTLRIEVHIILKIEMQITEKSSKCGNGVVAFSRATKAAPRSKKKRKLFGCLARLVCLRVCRIHATRRQRSSIGKGKLCTYIRWNRWMKSSITSLLREITTTLYYRSERNETFEILLGWTGTETFDIITTCSSFIVYSYFCLFILDIRD